MRQFSLVISTDLLQDTQCKHKPRFKACGEESTGWGGGLELEHLFKKTAPLSDAHPTVLWQLIHMA